MPHQMVVMVLPQTLSKEIMVVQVVDLTQMVQVEEVVDPHLLEQQEQDMAHRLPKVVTEALVLILQ